MQYDSTYLFCILLVWFCYQNTQSTLFVIIKYPVVFISADVIYLMFVHLAYVIHMSIIFKDIFTEVVCS